MTRGSIPPQAVIELGTTSLRMVVAEVGPDGQMTILEELQQAISLGRGTLVSGRISPETMESCISGLRSFRRLLDEYRIARKKESVRVVATSAVREASNREAFLDRILIATGLDVEVLDEAEVNRLTYRAIRPQLKSQPLLRTSDVLVVEVGGGSTETLLFRKGKIGASHMYRMGALRLRTLIEDENISARRSESMMRSVIENTICEMVQTFAPTSSLQLLLLGSDVRFAAAQLAPAWNRQSVCRLQANALSGFIRMILEKTVDEVTEQYNLNYPEAETLGPALLIYQRLLEELKVETVLVGEATLRRGVLLEMATGEHWTTEFKRQVITSALDIARKYRVDLRHARNVADYASRIFRVLQSKVEMGARDEVVLHVAALLHEVGLAVNISSHHKHSRYLILNSDLFGLRRRDIELAAIVARYHRRSEPKTSHLDYLALPREERITVNELAAILRVANSLDRLRSKRPLKLDITLAAEQFVIWIATDSDTTLIKRRVSERSKLFRDVFGMRVEVRTGTKRQEAVL